MLTAPRTLLATLALLTACGPSLRTDHTVTVLSPPPPPPLVVATANPPPAIATDGAPRIICPAPSTALAGTPVNLQAQTAGDGVRVRWEVRASPAHNRAYRFADHFDNNDTDAVVAVGAAVPFTSVIVGEYAVVATARDAEGRTATCETTVAMTGHGLRVELSWNTQNTDVDLHATRGEVRPWFTPADCYYASRQPDMAYPDEGRRRWLDTDDVDGEGPENIRVDTPDGTEDYHIGVHYYSSHGAHEPTHATVVVYCGERQMARFERDLIGDRGVDNNDFWNVARVRFGGANGCLVTPVQTVQPRRTLGAG